MCVGQSFLTDSKPKSIYLFRFVVLICLLNQDSTQNWIGTHLLKSSVHKELKVAQVHSNLNEEIYSVLIYKGKISPAYLHKGCIELTNCHSN